MTGIQKHVFIVLTADDCSWCTKFKTETWSTLKQKLINSGRLEIIEINVNKMSDTNGEDFYEKYPSDLKRFFGWFPCFVLLTQASWKIGMNFEGSVFNGKSVYDSETGEEVVEPIGSAEPTTENITQWLSDELRSNKFVMSSQNQQQQQQQNKLILTDRRGKQQPLVKKNEKKNVLKARVI